MSHESEVTPHTAAQRKLSGGRRSRRTRLATRTPAARSLRRSVGQPRRSRDSVWDDDGSRWLDLDLGGMPRLGARPARRSPRKRSIARSAPTAARWPRATSSPSTATRTASATSSASGHTYRAATRKGRRAPPELAGQVQDVLDAVHRREPLAPAAAGNRPPPRPRRRSLPAVLRRRRRPDARAVRRAGPGRHAARAPPTIRRPASAFRPIRDDVENVLAYYIDGVAVDAARDPASQGERRRQREARPAAVLSGAQEPAAGREAAAQHERRGRDPVGHRPDPQASRRQRAAAVQQFVAGAGRRAA